MKIHFLFFYFSIFFICSCGQKEQTVVDKPKPSGNCTYSRNEKDPLGRQIRVVQDEKFISFSFADSTEKAGHSGDDFLKGYLSCVNVDTVLGIYFDFIINTADAFQFYGMIKKNNKINFILKSGKTVEVPFGQTFSGNTNLSNETTEYSSFAQISHAEAEQLTSEELQRVIISWSKKQEEYIAVNPAIFINQIPCVK